MTPAEKDRLLLNAEQLFASADALRDLDDGYSVGFEHVSAEKLMQMADFVAFDRLCCAFLRHSIIVDQHPGMTWLEFTGAPGAKGGSCQRPAQVAACPTSCGRRLRRALGYEGTCPERAGLNAEVNIELLAVPDCPNIALARERVRAALNELGALATVHERVIDTDAEAARCGMRGSPTVLINGIDPFAEPTMQHSVSCRLYAVDGGVQGSPSIGQLVRAMSASSGGEAG